MLEVSPQAYNMSFHACMQLAYALRTSFDHACDVSLSYAILRSRKTEIGRLVAKLYRGLYSNDLGLSTE